jgi:hypothetical protein
MTAHGRCPLVRVGSVRFARCGRSVRSLGREGAPARSGRRAPDAHDPRNWTVVALRRERVCLTVQFRDRCFPEHPSRPHFLLCAAGARQVRAPGGPRVRPPVEQRENLVRELTLEHWNGTGARAHARSLSRFGTDTSSLSRGADRVARASACAPGKQRSLNWTVRLTLSPRTAGTVEFWGSCAAGVRGLALAAL